MNILITGVAGFIGSNVLCYLVKKYPNYFFLGIDKISYCSSVKNFEEIENNENFVFVQADITNLEFMDFLFREYKINTVMHFAAYTHVDHSFGNSIIFTQNNVVGTHVLLETSKKHDISRFIHVSTDEVYGCQEGKSTERSILEPTNPYAATKAAAEHIVNSYHISFGLPIIITRGNNVYGPKQFPEKVIPKFIQSILAGEDLTIHGAGTQKRSFLYSLDVARAFDIILHNGEIGETYNIGCEIEYNILDLARKLKDKMESGVEVVHVKDREFNDQRYFISIDKLYQLGWKPEILFDEGLDLTIKWYKNHPNYFD